MRKLSFGIAGLVGALVLMGGATEAAAQRGRCETQAPIIFVHGGAGSVSQLADSFQRFASNGYPMNRFAAVEYDSSQIQQILPQVLDRIDAQVDRLQRQTGCDRVNLVGHSLGTLVSQEYLSTPMRAMRVLNYVNADGRAAASSPGADQGVRTLNLVAGAARANPQANMIPGARNVVLPGELHIGAVSGAAAFLQMFQMFTGQEPASVNPSPAQSTSVIVAGRVSTFVANTPIAGAQLTVFEIDSNGERLLDSARNQIAAARIPFLPADGSFAVRVRRGARLEFFLERPGQVPQSFYAEGFSANQPFVRLQTTEETAEEIDARSDDTVTMIVSRQSELRSGVPGDTDDMLIINGTNVITRSTVPCCQVGVAPAALVIADFNGDGQSDLSTTQNVQAFVAGADFAIEAGGEPIRIVFVPRGDQTRARSFSIPALAASERRINLMLNQPSPQVRF